MKKILDWVGKKSLWIVASLLFSTLRVRRHNAKFFEDVRAGKQPFVLAFWHGSMLFGWYLHRPSHDGRVAALVSRSGDGEILAATLEHWNYRLIRGSSHVGGKEALQLMIEAVAAGDPLCITPDGPTGPRHRMKAGAIRIAQQTRVPLFLVGMAARRRRLLKSWDHFEVPMPFSPVSVWYSEPVIVPPDLREEAFDEYLRTRETELEELHRKAEEECFHD